MLGSRVALSTTLVRTLELLVETLSAPAALSRGAVAVVGVVGVVFAIPPAPPRLAAVARGGRGGRLRVVGAGGGVHSVAQLRLGVGQVRRVCSMHG